MKRTNTVFYTRRTLILSLLSFVAVAALVSFSVSARRANRATVLKANNSTAKPLSSVQDKSPNAPNAASITATLTDNTAAQVAPGGTINYTAVITNAPGTVPTDNALSLVYNATLDANTTLVGGSIQVSPVPVNDTFPVTVTGNVQINSASLAVPFSVVSNDYQGQNGGVVSIGTSGTSANGGQVVLNNTPGLNFGQFTYNPPSGFEGTDTFTYTLTNSVGTTTAATVSIPVSGMIWFIQNGAAACTTIAAGCGRLTNPFSSLAAFQALNNGGVGSTNPAVGDNIFIYEHATDYTGGVTLLSNQKLIGQDSTDTLETISGITPVTGSNALPAMNTGAPATTLSGAGITLNALATTNVIRGMTITNTAANTKISGTSFGTLTVGKSGSPDVTLSGTGRALSLTTGSFAVTSAFVSVAATSSTAQGINLVSVGGTVAFGSTAIGATTSQGILVNTSSVNITYGNTTVATTGSTGVNLTTNTGTHTFADLDITPNAGQRAFLATSNTAAITSTSGTISTTTGTAVEITGAGTPLNMQLTSVSANGGTNGIVLTNTSSTGAPGGFRVLGTASGTDRCGGTITPNAVGTAATVNAAVPAECLGGTIQSTTGNGIALNNVVNASFARMRILNSGTDGINVLTINGFTLTNSLITDSAGVAGDKGIEIGDFSTGTPVNGAIAVTNSTIGPTPHDNFAVGIASGTSTWNITGTLFDDSQLNSGFNFENRTATVSSFMMDGCVLRSQFADGMQMQPASGTNGTILSATIQNTSFLNNNIGMDLNHDGTAFVTYKVFANTFLNQVANSINFFSSAVQAPATGGVLNGRFTGNVIGNAAVFASGGGVGIRVNINGGADTNVLLDSNTIRQVPDGRGIEIISRNGTGGTDATVTNNFVNTDFVPTVPNGGFSLSNIFLQSNCLTVCNTLRADVRGNTVPAVAPTGELVAGQLVMIESGASTAQLVDNLPASANAAAELASNNTGSTAATAGVALIAGPITLPPAFRHTLEEVAGRTTGTVDNQRAASMASAESVQAPSSVSVQPLNNERDLSGARRSHHAQFNRARSLKAVREDKPLAPESGEAIGPINVGTLQPGMSVTILYAATVNAPPTARQASHQGTVTFTNGVGSPLLTDDPDVVGAANPTVTLFDTLMTWNGVTSTDWNTATNWTQPAGGTPYAPGVSNPAVNDVAIPNVANQPNISATDIGVYSLNISNGSTLTITSPRILTIGGTPGGDLTLDGIISGGELRFGTGTHAFNNAGGTGSLSSTNLMRVISGATVTLNHNLQAGAFVIDAGGSMDVTNRTASLNGSGAALAVAGTFTTIGSTMVFNGTAAQQAAGLSYNNLTINNTIGLNVTGVTLTGNATVNGALALTSSDLDTGAFTLTQPNTTASTGVSDVVGTIARTGGPFAPGVTLTFGNPNNQITFTAAGTKPSSMTVTMAKAAPATYAGAVQRNYIITPTGGVGYTATLRLHYLDTELNGNTPEANLNLRRGPSWNAVLPSVVDSTNNWVESNAVTAFSQWTFSALAPTASSGAVTGRITAADGSPVEGAVVVLSGAQNRKFITDANGFYRFDNVETNGFYNVTPFRVNYTFSPAVISFSQIGETTNATFGATATGGAVNPLDTPEYFVRQNYLDFLGREPDEAGFNFWSDQILGCGGDTDCVDRNRTNVSAAYFLSIEFQQTGGLVDGLYRASFARRPNYGEFKPDAAAVAPLLVVGADGWKSALENGKTAFIDAFVQRAAFRTAFDGMTNETYVDALIANTGVSFTSDERNAFVSGLGGGMTRAAVLRAIVEDADFAAAKRNDAFVMMEYFGYLRREPDTDGYNYWLNKLIQFNGNFEQAEMVRAFILSTEYRQRFPR